MKVDLRGEGVAAACCAALLRRNGIGLHVDRPSRPPPPVVMLSDQALALVRDVLGLPALWSDMPRVERRVVAWGAAEPVAVRHAATIVPGDALAAALDPFLRSDVPEGAADVTIHAARPFGFGEMRRFGRREACSAAVRVLQADDRSACWIEAVADGWLFLIPAGGEQGWLLGVGAPLGGLLDDSRLIAPRIDALGGSGESFETSPALLYPLRAERALACGSAAVAFDPLCGDGTSQAAREAILAAAVIAGIAEGGDGDALLAHYEAMIVAAMRRHLAMCMPFYRSGGDSGWWRDQLDRLVEGHDWCTARLAVTPEPRFRLEGDRLVARAVAA